MRNWIGAILASAVHAANQCDNSEFSYQTNPDNCWINGCYNMASLIPEPAPVDDYKTCFDSEAAFKQDKIIQLRDEWDDKVRASEVQLAQDVKRLGWCDATFNNSLAIAPAGADLETYSVSNYNSIIDNRDYKDKTTGDPLARAGGQQYDLRLAAYNKLFDDWVTRWHISGKDPQFPNPAAQQPLTYYQRFLTTELQRGLDGKRQEALNARDEAYSVFNGSSPQFSSNYQDWIGAESDFRGSYLAKSQAECFNKDLSNFKQFFGTNYRDNVAAQTAYDQAKIASGSTESASSILSQLSQSDQRWSASISNYVQKFYENALAQAQSNAKSSGIQQIASASTTASDIQTAASNPAAFPYVAVDFQTDQQAAAQEELTYQGLQSSYVTACAYDGFDSYKSLMTQYWQSYDARVADSQTKIESGLNTVASLYDVYPGPGSTTMQSRLTQFCSAMKSAGTVQTSKDAAIATLASSFDGVADSQKVQFLNALTAAELDSQQPNSTYQQYENINWSVDQENTFPSESTLKEMNCQLAYMKTNESYKTTSGCDITPYESSISTAVNTNLKAWYEAYRVKDDALNKRYRRYVWDQAKLLVDNQANPAFVGGACHTYAQTAKWVTSRTQVVGQPSLTDLAIKTNAESYIASQEFINWDKCQKAKIEQARYQPTGQSIHNLILEADARHTAATYNKPTVKASGDKTRYAERLALLEVEITELQARINNVNVNLRDICTGNLFDDWLRAGQENRGDCLKTQLDVLLNDRHDMQEWQKWYAGEQTVSELYSLQIASFDRPSDLSLIKYTGPADLAGNVWTELTGFATTAIDCGVRCVKTEADYWSKAQTLGYTTQSVAPANQVLSATGRAWSDPNTPAKVSDANEQKFKDFQDCTGVNARSTTNLSTDPRDTTAQTVPAIQRPGSYTGAVSGYYSSYFSLHLTWYNADVAYEEYKKDKDRSDAADAISAEVKPDNKDFIQCQVAQYSNADHQTVVNFYRPEIAKLELDINTLRGKCFNKDRRSSRCSPGAYKTYYDTENYQYYNDTTVAYFPNGYLGDDRQSNTEGTKVQGNQIVGDKSTDSLARDYEGAVLLEIRESMILLPSSMVEYKNNTFINALGVETTGDGATLDEFNRAAFETVSKRTGEWVQDACEYYKVFDSAVKPCLDQAVLLASATYPTAIKEKDFPWANAILVCLNVIGCAIFTIIAHVIMFRYMMGRMGREMGSVSGTMGDQPSDASQVGLQNDVSADVGFNTNIAQPSVLLSKQGTPQGNVSVEPATQQNGAPSENSNSGNQQKDVVAELEEIL